ncbi:protein PTHB1 [Diachasma alloeum]|uniref:protein PTHB1 n=1 Tax=Diachasma alloeum TaxID=454923 RepID=UPI0007383238|nr:protein PTHB1 [Diachasma alloeum]
MSLFRTKEWWRTECGNGETFDGQSLLVVPLFGEEKRDIIIVASHSGNLRIYSPSAQWNDETNSSSGYKLTDLIIETKIADCIIDVKSGKFVSGSQDVRLGVLMPTKLVVYGVTLTAGSTEHGDRCVLEAVYEHELPRFPASLVSGPFGAARGRDFFCVQCIDGTLLFYEQESHTFVQTLKNRLLPEPIAYAPKNDVFITTTPGWCLECYRYQNMAEFGRTAEERKMKGEERSLEPDWTYNLGEAVLGIEPVTLTSFEVGIVVLGERNLYCFRDNCTGVKYAKRLDYTPLCFHAYVIEPDGKLMVLVVADTDTLLVYEGTTLKWSAQLPFTPVAIARAHFQQLEGVVVILSDEGRLEACYLGAEPSLFVAPPIHRRGFDYKAAEDELVELRKIAKSTCNTSKEIASATVESELLVTVDISKDLEKSPATGENEGEQDSMCRISIEVSSYTPLTNVELNIEVLRPLVVTDGYHIFPTLRERQLIQTTIYITEALPLLSSEARITASYETDNGGLRVLQKPIQLPLRMMLRACPPENNASFSVTIKCLDPLVNFSQLFPEFIVDTTQRQSSNALGLRILNTNHVVTIVAGTNTNRYRVQSNDPLSVTVVLQQMVARLKSRSPGSILTSIGQNHLQLVQTQIEAHFASRQRVKILSNEVALLTTQLRNIERKILRGIRDRNVRSLGATGLPVLLESTYRAMFFNLQELEAAQAERKRAGHGLQCAVRLLLLLIRPNVNDEKYAILESAIGFEPQLRDDVDWEEVADVALFALLRATSRKPENEPSTRQLTWNKFDTARDLAKLKKRLVHAVERLSKPLESVQENEPGDNV